ncbi:MAG: EamA family transporter [Schwartzia sp.]|nr:EamA family transporter [Schwartzia sp. (in: firmicutes)]MBQ4151982.1 EamA family transporter [Schwartzia sp. (in: firmicutes)]MBQ5413228.1 EamA family transporter [Schwartzia sp. (in: firmicutes)]
MNVRTKGVLMAVSGGTLWGASGVAGQYLLQECAFQPEWLVASRMIFAGIVFLAIDAFRSSGHIFDIWKNRRDAFMLIFFALVGMLLVQYSYFVSIIYGNAAAATVLQYTMPAFLVVYMSLKSRRLPRPIEILCVLLAMGGTFLLVTHGSLETFVIPLPALVWGLISGVAGAVYTLSPKGLIRDWNAPLVIGWGMIAGGLPMSVIAPPWDSTGVWNLYSSLAFIYILIFGTVFAFWLYLGSTQYIQPGEAGVLASVEPVTAIVISSLLLGQSFELMDIAGSALILLTVFILARR